MSMEVVTLEWFESTDALQVAGLVGDPWGITPGEEGCDVLLLLVTTPCAGLSCVISVARTSGPKHMASQFVCIGEGLMNAIFGSLLAYQRSARLCDIHCDLMPQAFRDDEFVCASISDPQGQRRSADLITPADYQMRVNWR